MHDDDQIQERQPALVDPNAPRDAYSNQTALFNFEGSGALQSNMPSDRAVLVYQKAPALQNEESPAIDLTNLYFKNMAQSFQSTAEVDTAVNPWFGPTAQDYQASIAGPMESCKFFDLGHGQGRKLMDSQACARTTSQDLLQRWHEEHANVSMRFDESMVSHDRAINNIKGSSESWRLIERLTRADKLVIR